MTEPVSKFLLVVGDSEQQVLDIPQEEEYMYLRDLVVNFGHTPSIVALYELYTEFVKETATRLRDQEIKVGVYATREKAQKFFWKMAGLENLQTATTLEQISSKLDSTKEV